VGPNRIVSQIPTTAKKKANGEKLSPLRMKLFTLAQGPAKDHASQKR
jgi:hypothetical protein